MALGLQVFDHAFGRILRLMHPVMPFLTEELYHHLGFAADDASIMTAPWPTELPAERRDAFLAVASHCTVHNTLTQPPNIEIALVTDVLAAP